MKAFLSRLRKNPQTSVAAGFALAAGIYSLIHEWPASLLDVKIGAGIASAIGVLLAADSKSEDPK
jgi:hypothetical protein